MVNISKKAMCQAKAKAEAEGRFIKHYWLFN